MLIQAFRYRYLPQSVNVYQHFLFCFTYIYCQVTCPTKKMADREESLIEVEDVWYELAM